MSLARVGYELSQLKLRSRFESTIDSLNLIHELNVIELKIKFVN
jgi:hypothetical protein